MVFLTPSSSLPLQINKYAFDRNVWPIYCIAIESGDPHDDSPLERLQEEAALLRQLADAPANNAGIIPTFGSDGVWRAAALRDYVADLRVCPLAGGRLVRMYVVRCGVV